VSFTRRFALSLAFAGALAPAATARAQEVVGTLRVALAATSTLHDFEGGAEPVSVSLSQDPSGGWSADVTLAVADLSTGIGWRDESMRSMFEADRHPRILGRVRGVDPEQVRRSGALAFVLRIRDVERPLTARVTQWQQSERRASFDAAFDVSLAAFGIEAPSLPFNRVGDVVHVTVHLDLERT
jgi:polyisoprenoid-binding protein YceI